MPEEKIAYYCGDKALTSVGNDLKAVCYGIYTLPADVAKKLEELDKMIDSLSAIYAPKIEVERQKAGRLNASPFIVGKESSADAIKTMMSVSDELMTKITPLIEQRRKLITDNKKEETFCVIDKTIQPFNTSSLSSDKVIDLITSKPTDVVPALRAITPEEWNNLLKNGKIEVQKRKIPIK